MTATRWRLLVGCDDAGLEYKTRIQQRLDQDGRVASVLDVGIFDADESRAYPSVAIDAAERIARGEADRAILICGTGIGMAISANKVPGIRATTAHDSYSVERSVLSNDCQVLALGQRVIGIELAQQLVSQWLDLHFAPRPGSEAKLAVIADYEGGNLVQRD